MSYKTAALVFGLYLGAKTVCRLIDKYKPKKYTSVVVHWKDTCPICKKNRGKMYPQRPCCLKPIDYVVELIDKARVSLDVCLYVVTCPILTAAVQRAFDRGVNIRFITDSEMAFATSSSIPVFHKAGIPVRLKKSVFMMHHKFCLVDDPGRARQLGLPPTREGLVMMGSFNWTLQARLGNWEFITFSLKPSHTKPFREAFDRLWDLFLPLSLHEMQLDRIASVSKEDKKDKEKDKADVSENSGDF